MSKRANVEMTIFVLSTPWRSIDTCLWFVVVSRHDGCKNVCSAEVIIYLLLMSQSVKKVIYCGFFSMFGGNWYIRLGEIRYPTFTGSLELRRKLSARQTKTKSGRSVGVFGISVFSSQNSGAPKMTLILFRQPSTDAPKVRCAGKFLC